MKFGRGFAGIARVVAAAVAGDSNSGHDYGTTLSENEKRDLIEYLKTL